MHDQIKEKLGFFFFFSWPDWFDLNRTGSEPSRRVVAPGTHCDELQREDQLPNSRDWVVMSKQRGDFKSRFTLIRSLSYSGSLRLSVTWKTEFIFMERRTARRRGICVCLKKDPREIIHTHTLNLKREGGMKIETRIVLAHTHADKRGHKLRLWSEAQLIPSSCCWGAALSLSPLRKG